jgi:WD40-like Beta Propeller Repeat
MRATAIAASGAVVSLALLLACQPEPYGVGPKLLADRFASAEWSDPVNLGAVINSSAFEGNAGLSSDALTLFFVSNRIGGLGENDIWMSHRQCVVCDWETPVNLGAPINSSAIDGSPAMSEDGRLLFFYSARPGGFGGGDIYVSHRVSAGADGDVWGPPVNLGPDVNTSAQEQGCYYVHEPGEANAFVYFNRPTPGGSADIYRVAVSNDGEALGPAVLVPELSDPTGFDQKVAVSTDGHELLLSSIRAGGFGNFDIWRFTRQSAHEPWSNPTHLDAPINTSDLDSQPSPSRDGRTLIFTSIRTGGYGAQDLWMSTRTPGGVVQ